MRLGMGLLVAPCLGACAVGSDTPPRAKTTCAVALLLLEPVSAIAALPDDVGPDLLRGGRTRRDALAALDGIDLHPTDCTPAEWVRYTRAAEDLCGQVHWYDFPPATVAGLCAAPPGASPE
jgi:hypothetical protein